MITILLALLAATRDSVRRSADLQVELLALRHQVMVLRRQRGERRLRLRRSDRWLWMILSRLWSGWRDTLVLVKPETVIARHRRGFRSFWRWKSRGRGPGRPAASGEVIALIRAMQKANPTWGAPRIHGELLKLGIDVAQSTVSKYLLRSKRSPSQGWRTFVRNHLGEMIAIDFAVVRTVRGPIVRGEILYGLARLPQGRRREDLTKQAAPLFATIACEPVPESAGDAYAHIKRTREQQGLALDENDLWIAATASALGATLVTRDSDFSSIEGLTTVDGRPDNRRVFDPAERRHRRELAAADRGIPLGEGAALPAARSRWRVRS